MRPSAVRAATARLEIGKRLPVIGCLDSLGVHDHDVLHFDGVCCVVRVEESEAVAQFTHLLQLLLVNQLHLDYLLHHLHLDHL